jgi:hypothetical protein
VPVRPRREVFTATAEESKAAHGRIEGHAIDRDVDLVPACCGSVWSFDGAALDRRVVINLKAGALRRGYGEVLERHASRLPDMHAVSRRTDVSARGVT